MRTLKIIALFLFLFLSSKHTSAQSPIMRDTAYLDFQYAYPVIFLDTAKKTYPASISLEIKETESAEWRFYYEFQVFSHNQNGYGLYQICSKTDTLYLRWKVKPLNFDSTFIKERVIIMPKKASEYSREINLAFKSSLVEKKCLGDTTMFSIQSISMGDTFSMKNLIFKNWNGNSNILDIKVFHKGSLLAKLKRISNDASNNLILYIMEVDSTLRINTGDTLSTMLTSFFSTNMGYYVSLDQGSLEPVVTKSKPFYRNVSCAPILSIREEACNTPRPLDISFSLNKDTFSLGEKVYLLVKMKNPEPVKLFIRGIFYEVEGDTSLCISDGAGEFCESQYDFSVRYHGFGEHSEVNHEYLHYVRISPIQIKGGYGVTNIRVNFQNPGLKSGIAYCIDETNTVVDSISFSGKSGFVDFVGLIPESYYGISIGFKINGTIQGDPFCFMGYQKTRPCGKVNIHSIWAKPDSNEIVIRYAAFLEGSFATLNGKPVFLKKSLSTGFTFYMKVVIAKTPFVELVSPCEDVDKKEVVTTSLGQISDPTLKIFPNPATDQLFIETEVLDSKGNFTLSDMSGKTVKRGFVNSTQTEIDISLLSAGMYMLAVRNGKFTTTKKIVVVK